MSEKTLGLIEENEARWVDLRFTDSRGKEQHVTIPCERSRMPTFFEVGKHVRRLIHRWLEGLLTNPT